MPCVCTHAQMAAYRHVKSATVGKKGVHQEQQQQQNLVQHFVFEGATLQVFSDNVGSHGWLGSDFSICRSWFVMTVTNIFHYVPVWAYDL